MYFKSIKSERVSIFHTLFQSHFITFATNFKYKKTILAKVFKTFQHQGVQCFQFGSSLFGQPRMFSHAYFIDGLLIDTGHRHMRKIALDTIKPLPVQQILITHHHEDHSGNLNPLEQHFQCPAYSSPHCAEIMKKPPPLSLAQHLSWGNRKPNFTLKTVGKTLKTPNYTFEVIPIPGHAIDMIGLYEPNQGWLFSSDLYVHHRIRYFMEPESMIEQIRSIERVLQLDFEALFCGHNPQLNGGKEKLQKKLVFFQNFYQTVVDYHKQGYSPKAIFKKMGLKDDLQSRIMTQGTISTINMIRAVIRDEANAKLT